MRTDESQVRSTQLSEQGWTRRFSALGRRLNEAVELYSQLGFEVLLEPANLDEDSVPRAGGCESCIVTTLARTIYTRPQSTLTVKIGNVILSGAKNLRVASEILRSAQNDRSLPNLDVKIHRVSRC